MASGVEWLTLTPGVPEVIDPATNPEEGRTGSLWHQFHTVTWQPFATAE